MNYTKGEWKAVEYDEHFDIRAINADGLEGFDADIAHVLKRIKGEAGEANANLVAASPSMYEALRHAEIVLVNLGVLNQQQELLKLEVEKALAKAEGKQ